MQQIRPGLGHLQPGLLEVRHVVGSREGNPEPRYGPPSGLRLAALGRERIPAAVPLTERVDEVAHVGQQVLEDEGNGAVGANHVVARLRLGLGGELGVELQVRDGVHADGRPRLLAERLRLPAQLVVGGGDEVVPGEEGQLALLSEGRRLAKAQPGRHPGRGAGRDA